jgi:hypothetical protein
MSMPTSPPPPFGHQLRQYFGFDADYINMNSGQLQLSSLNAPKAMFALMFSVQVPTASCRTQFSLPPRLLSGP